MIVGVGNKQPTLIDGIYRGSEFPEAWEVSKRVPSMTGLLMVQMLMPNSSKRVVW